MVGNVQVRSNGIRYNELPRFTYSDAMTPTISSIQPASGTKIILLAVMVVS